MAPKRKPFRFRIRIASNPSRFLSVNISDTRESMWREIKNNDGQKHNNEYACCMYSPGSPERGCVANLYFYFRGLKPSIIAHEGSHAVQAILAADPPGPGTDVDERSARILERIVEKIWVRAQSAPL